MSTKGKDNGNGNRRLKGAKGGILASDDRWLERLRLELTWFTGQAALRSRGAGAILRFAHVRPRRRGGFQPLRESEITPQFLDRAIRALKRWNYDLLGMDEVCRRAVTLPEKRQFFLEGQEQFNQRFPNRYPTFYSRRIADISTGEKLLGKQGPWAVSFISAESNPSGADQSANYSVGRVQRDILGRSTVAVMASNRRFNSADQGAFSADTSLFFGRTFSMTAQGIMRFLSLR